MTGNDQSAMAALRQDLDALKEYVDAQFNAIKEYIDKQFEAYDQSLEAHSQSLEAHDQVLDLADNRINALEELTRTRIDALEDRLNDL